VSSEHSTIVWDSKIVTKGVTLELTLRTTPKLFPRGRSLWVVLGSEVYGLVITVGSARFWTIRRNNDRMLSQICDVVSSGRVDNDGSRLERTAQ
jgi:hypothetical protein